MKNLTKAGIALGITLTFGATQVAPAMGAQPNTAVSSTINGLNNNSALEDLINRADPFVSVVGDQFVFDQAGASTMLSDSEIVYALKLIASSNDLVSAAISDGAVSDRTASTITLSSARDVFSPLALREGVTKVEAHWYGFRVWLSKSALRAIGAGVGIGALWIPEPIVSKVLASLGGAVAAFAPGGVVFNYTPVVTPATPLGAFWGQAWQ